MEGLAVEIKLRFYLSRVFSGVMWKLPEMQFIVIIYIYFFLSLFTIPFNRNFVWGSVGVNKDLEVN